MSDSKSFQAQPLRIGSRVRCDNGPHSFWRNVTGTIVGKPISNYVTKFNVAIDNPDNTWITCNVSVDKCTTNQKVQYQRGQTLVTKYTFSGIFDKYEDATHLFLELLVLPSALQEQEQEQEFKVYSGVFIKVTSHHDIIHIDV